MEDKIQIATREPLEIPDFLRECLTRLHLYEGVRELIGPRFNTDDIVVYGYYVPLMRHILCPCNTLLTERADLEGPDESRESICSISAVQELMCNFCGLANYTGKILYENESPEDFCSLIFQKAIKEHEYCLDLFLIGKKSELLSWNEIWNIFDIERYSLVKDANMLIETENFIIYLHLPEFDSDVPSKSIFRFYCNNRNMPTVPFVILSECKEKMLLSSKGLHFEPASYEYVSDMSDIIYRLNRGKPIVKFDGITIESNGCIKFGYRYDGIYRAYAFNQQCNILLK